jgi:hypothetical protein
MVASRVEKEKFSGCGSSNSYMTTEGKPNGAGTTDKGIFLGRVLGTDPPDDKLAAYITRYMETPLLSLDSYSLSLF